MSARSALKDPRIIFEDPNVIVLDKPAGMLSQGASKGDGNLVDWLREYLKRHYVGLIHRLDRNTSGVILVAKRTKAAARLTKALQDGKVERKYIAWLEGNLSGEQCWEHYLSKDEKTNTVHIVSPKNRDAKPAVLRVRSLEEREWRKKKITLAEFKLETGRSHQIRVQTAEEGYPVIGDVKYNKSSSASWAARPLLHSRWISFPHPISGEVLKFESPLPADMKLEK